MGENFLCGHAERRFRLSSDEILLQRAIRAFLMVYLQLPSSHSVVLCVRAFQKACASLLLGKYNTISHNLVRFPLRRGLHGSKISIVCVKQLPNLDTSQMVLARERGIVVEQPPPPLKFHNRMMRRPSLNGIQDLASIREWACWRRSSGVAKQMSVAGGV